MQEVNYNNLITRTHLCTILGVHYTTILRYEKMGLPVIRIGEGKLPRYDYEEVMDWVKKRAEVGNE